MSIYAIGDVHLSLSSNKPMNIFKGWDDYVERLTNNWQKVVGVDDTVVINGDVSWAMSLNEAKKDFEYLNSLNGNKIILKGNHDYWWNTVKKMEEFLNENNFDTIRILHNNAYKAENISIAGSRGWFYDAEKENSDKILIRECDRIRRSIESGFKQSDEVVVFLHYPPVGLIKDCEPIINVLKEYGIKRCYYGHLHGASIKNAVNSEKYGIKFKLISADYLEFCPYSIEI